MLKESGVCHSLLLLLVVYIVLVVACAIDVYGEYVFLLVCMLDRFNHAVVCGDYEEQRPVGVPHSPGATEKKIYRNDNQYDWEGGRVFLYRAVEYSAHNHRHEEKNPTRVPKFAKKTYKQIRNRAEKKSSAVYRA